MTAIGRPQQENAFAGIQRASSRPGSLRESDSVGDQLNRIAGRVPESRYKSFEEHTQLDKDDFLKLLAHQLQNQDPMNPMDQKDFASDLAQFSQLEQMTNMNSSIEKLGKNAGHEEKFYGASFLGKEVFTEGSTINFDGVNQPLIPFSLDRSASKVLVRVFDERGQLISQLERESMSEGPQNMRWDGISNDGTRATGGTYRVEVLAWDHNEELFQGQTQGTGIVSGVQFENGDTILVLEGGRRISLRDVTSFAMPEDTRQSQIEALQGQLEQLKQGQTNSGGAVRQKGAGLPKAVQKAYDNNSSHSRGLSNF